VAAALARVRDCTGAEVRTGVIRSSASGLGSVWAQCPLVAARKAADCRRTRVGWTSARVVALEARRLECF
ncbi:PREDICTED: uncharacterized protein LOC108549883, partial [Eufriesea mexicana]|uniref:uncharacterized protein LOC108549883 n=1 Tax=Eufriesea mexicana TaxID=516756 RepID=UPI00083C5785